MEDTTKTAQGEKPALSEEQATTIRLAAFKVAKDQVAKAAKEHGTEGAIYATSGLFAASAQTIAASILVTSGRGENVADMQPKIEATVRDLRRMLCDNIVRLMRAMGQTP